MPLDSQAVVAFWAHMLSRFDAQVVDKQSSVAMQATSRLLDALGIVDREAFMQSFVTTLGRRIYTPFKVGVEEGKWVFWTQVRVCVHECQHVVQGVRDGWATFDSRYIASSSYRAGYEAEAFGSDLEMEFWRTGTVLDIPSRASVLKSYGCSAEDISMVEQMLEMRAKVVSQGVVFNESTKAAVAWLEANVLRPL